MSYSTWRDKAAPIIAEVLRVTAGKPEADIKKALLEAYPFGPRKYRPYKIWCDEIRRQRGLKKPKPAVKRERKRAEVAGQASLFEEES